MQDVDDDINELFRRAANDYPLNTNNADWSKVAKLLNPNENEDAGSSSAQKKKYPNILLLILLLCVPMICVDYFLANNSVSYKTETLKTHENRLSAGPVSHTKDTLLKANTITPSSLVANADEQRNNTPSQAIINKQNINNKDLIGSELPALTPDNNEAIQKPSNNYNESVDASESSRSDNLSVNKFSEKNNTPNINAPLSTTNTDTTFSRVERNPKGAFDTSSINSVEVKKEAITRLVKNKRWYAGILVGPDLSTVKFQPVTKTGFSAGLLIGYSLNGKIDLETGIFWDKKFYYTDGKYFNPKNYSIPSFISIDDVNGNCNMIEWPVNVSYKLRSFNKSSLSANIGISSYFMKNENYKYTFQRNGTENQWDLSYKNSSVNLFSVVNAGASYSHNFVKSTLLRIQPYVKIPISGIGMGRLPVSSAGINFILTKRIF